MSRMKVLAVFPRGIRRKIQYAGNHTAYWVAIQNGRQRNFTGRVSFDSGEPVFTFNSPEDHEWFMDCYHPARSVYLDQSEEARRERQRSYNRKTYARKQERVQREEQGGHGALDRGAGSPRR